MARTLIGEVELRLRDNLTPGAKAAKEALQGVKSAADALGSGSKLNALTQSLTEAQKQAKGLAEAMQGAKWPQSFSQQLARSRVSPEEVRRLRREYEELAKAIEARGLDMGSRDARRELALWRTGALNAINDVKAAQAALTKEAIQAARDQALQQKQAEADRARAAVAAQREAAAAARAAAREAAEAARAAAAEQKRLAREVSAAEKAAAREAVAAARQAAREKAQAAKEAAAAERAAAREAARAAREAARAERDAARAAQRERGGGAMFNSAGSATRFAATAAGVGGAAVTTNRLVRMANTVGGESMANDTRARLGGLTPEQIAAINNSAFALSRRYRSVSYTDMQESLRDLAQSMGGVFGGVDKALQVSDAVASASVLLGNLYGQERAQRSLRQGFRALDNLNRNIDPQRFRTIMEGWTRAALVEGPEFDIGRMFTFAKYSKSAGGALSDRFLYETLPALVNDMGESRVGTALGTAMSNVVGNKGTVEMMREQQRLGLRSGFTNRRSPGTFGNAAAFSEDPDQYAWNILKPALQRAGIDTNNETEVSQALNKMFPQMVADLFSKLISQEEQYRRKQRQNRAAAGFDAADMLAEQDWRVALQAVVAQFKNTIEALSTPVMQALLPTMKDLHTALSDWAAWAKSNPEEVKAAFKDLATTTGYVIAGLAALKVTQVVAMAAAGPALILASTSLKGAAAALTAAAAALGKGGLPGIPGGRGGAAGGAGGAALGALGAAGRMLPGVAAAGAIIAGGYYAGEVIGELGRIVEGAHWTPKDQEELDYYKQRLAEAQQRREGIDARTHPSMRGAPNPERANLDTEIADLENRIRAGEERLAAAARQAGTAAGEGVAEGIRERAPSVIEQMNQIMGQIRAMAGQPVQVNITPTLAPGTAPLGVGATPPGRSLGGPVAAGRLYNINEAGQEWFVPGANGSIIPNHALGRGGGRGGGAVNVSMGGITINGGNAQEIADQIADKIKSAMRGAFSDSSEAWG